MPIEQAPDTQPGYYYVSVVDGDRHGLLLGPFENDHAKALVMVDAVRRKAQEVNRMAVFYAFGTCRLPLDCAPPQGRLNDLFDSRTPCIPALQGVTL